jgi:hypothetical protein
MTKVEGGHWRGGGEGGKERERERERERESGSERESDWMVNREIIHYTER